MSLLKLEFITIITKKIAGELQLSKNQLLILMAMGTTEDDGIRQSKLAPLFGADKVQGRKYAMSKISQALRGTLGRLFTQKTIDSDGRAKILRITKSGRLLYGKALKKIEQEQKELGQKIGHDKVKQLVSLGGDASKALGWPV